MSFVCFPVALKRTIPRHDIMLKAGLLEVEVEVVNQETKRSRWQGQTLRKEDPCAREVQYGLIVIPFDARG